MNNTAKHKILLIEPSEIVAAGITAIIARSPEFAIAQTLSNPGYYNPQSSNIDIIIINPAVIDYNERFDIRSYFGKENVTIIALTHGSYEENVLRQYDGCIGIYDSAQRIVQKIKSAMEEATQAPKSDINELSTRERDILRAVAMGKTNKEIADEFNISIYTVISHRRNISQKLGINSIPGLTVYAIMNKLVDMSDFG
ncbi:MAG: response regulator transcription factor [Bacteroidaceae bacterium]|nr:response regulator transcription factor [Bacteroidales bacterium]MBO5263285.1 response regulator transcription factor [Bacteroidaceae bacterium]MBQ8257216.1 response regulator transcription factor [Bacteroidaceae bacterium]